MSDILIDAERVGKKFRIGRDPYARLSELPLHFGRSAARWLKRRLAAPAGSLPQEERASEEFWALRDVSFQVRKGEVLGIIGPNGAGKSTLLKILSRITKPTTGEIRLRGRVGSLLEVGTGFHPELTGAENIYLNGTFLGMCRAEIRRKFEDIVAFAEIDQFLHTPVKHYSTGMCMRLAFAVAAHLEPEILVVDEGMAVGDVAFQRKCVDKMSEAAKGGRTILFVSHHMQAVSALCHRVLWLNRGKVRADGPADETVGAYVRDSLAFKSNAWVAPSEDIIGDRVQLLRADVTPDSGEQDGVMRIDCPIRMDFVVFSPREQADVSVNIVVYTLDGTCLFNSASAPIAMKRGQIHAICRIPGNLLNCGSYRVRLLLVEKHTDILRDIEDVLRFEVVEGAQQSNAHGRWIGVLRPRLDWSITVQDTDTQKAGRA